MKNIHLFGAIALSILHLGCETRLFKYTVSIDQPGQFVVDDLDGTYITSTFISRSSIARAFNLPSGARVTELKIESLSLSVAVAPTNNANAVTVSGYLGRSATSTEQLFREVPVVLAGANIPGVGLNDIIEGKMGELQRTLEDFVKGIGAGNLVELAIAGTSTPSGRRISFTISMHIQATVKYERCEEIVKGMSDAPACSEGESGN
jgi:hypothetical protein